MVTNFYFKQYILRVLKSKGFGGTFNCLKYQKFLATARFPNQNKHFLGNNWCPQSQNIQRCFTINVTLNGSFNCTKSKKSSLTRDFPIKIKHLVLMASYALSNVKTIQIYGDKNCALCSLGSGGACGGPFSCILL